MLSRFTNRPTSLAVRAAAWKLTGATCKAGSKMLSRKVFLVRPDEQMITEYQRRNVRPLRQQSSHSRANDLVV